MKTILAALSAVKRPDLSKRSVSLLLLGPMAIWLVLFLIVPLLFIFVYGFLTYENYGVVWEFTLSNYYQITDPSTYENMLRTFGIAAVITVLTILLAYPAAYYLNFKTGKLTSIFLLLLLIVPFWISPIIRTYGWFPLLGQRGAFNVILMNLGVIDTPTDIFLYSRISLGLAYLQNYVVFMIAPIYIAMGRIDPELHSAAASLRANPWETFAYVTFPLSIAGPIVGSVFVFVLALGNLIIPQLLGGIMTTTSTIIYQNVNVVNWPAASGLSVWSILISFFSVYLLIRLVDILSLFETA